MDRVDRAAGGASAQTGQFATRRERGLVTAQTGQPAIWRDGVDWWRRRLDSLRYGVKRGVVTAQTRQSALQREGVESDGADWTACDMA
jgi:hypothetical protein